MFWQLTPACLQGQRFLLLQRVRQLQGLRDDEILLCVVERSIGADFLVNSSLVGRSGCSLVGRDGRSLVEFSSVFS